MKLDHRLPFSASVILFAVAIATPLSGARIPDRSPGDVDTAPQTCEGAIRGIVRAASQPLRDVQVFVWPSTSHRDSATRVTTDLAGAYVHGDLRPGLYNVVLAGVDTTVVSGLGTIQTVRVARNDTSSVDFLGTWRRDAAIVGTIEIESRFLSHVLVTAVRHPDPQLPVPDGPYTTVTDPDGRYLLSEVPPGVYDLKAWDDVTPRRFRDTTLLVAVGVGNTENVPFSLRLERDNWTAQGDLYWILGIAIPIIMVSIAIGTILINSATRLSNVKRANYKLESWLAKSQSVERKQKIIDTVSERSLMAGLARLRARLWLVLHVPFVRHKYLDNEEISKRRAYTKFLDRQRCDLERQQDDDQRDVGSLFSGIWDGIKVMCNRGGGHALALGVVTSVTALVIVNNLRADPSIQPPEYEAAIMEMWLALAVVAGMVYYAGCFAGRLSSADPHTRIGAFAWGSAIPVFIGLNAIELSGFDLPDNDRLYDSQTIDMMFVCVAMILIVREVLYRRHVAPSSRAGADRHQEYQIVRTTLWFAADGGRLERNLRILLSLCYLLVVAHLLAPAVADMIIFGTMFVDLITITSVVFAALWVPLIALIADGRGRAEGSVG